MIMKYRQQAKLKKSKFTRQEIIIKKLYDEGKLKPWQIPKYLRRRILLSSYPLIPNPLPPPPPRSHPSLPTQLPPQPPQPKTQGS